MGSTGDLDHIRDAYDQYQAERAVLKKRIQRRVEAELATESEGLTREFSRLLHEAYAAGAKIKDLRRATKQYGSGGWDELWNAASDAPVIAQGRPPMRREIEKKELGND